MRLILDNNSPPELTNHDWIGQIPSYWDLKKFKYIFEEKKSTKNTILNAGSISFGEVIYKNEDKITELTKNSYQEVLNGEFLINPLNLNFDLKSLRIGLSKINVVVSQGYIVLKINKGFCPDYYKYLLRKFDVEYMKSLGQGVRQTISFNDIKDEYLVIPPLTEQRIISHYLDKKTQNIDSLIEKTEKKIELLNEQKTAMINQYVTRGLDLNVEMKDSGVKGIGDIPKNWSLKKISHIVNFIGSGTTPKSNLKEYYENGEVNWLITGDLNDNEIYETSKKITLKAQEDTSLKTYPSNSLVIAMYGATIGKLGILKVKSTVNQACCVLNFDINQDIDFWFNSFLGNREYLISLGYGGGQPNISQETIKGLRLPSPPDKSEQILISKFLKKQSKKINNLIKKHIKKKDLLCEYRKSLISSVVTGKIRITEDMI